MLFLSFAAFTGCKDSDDEGGRPTPSGFAVPRYISLKYSEINARSGPTERNRILWTYRAVHLPLLVIAETSEWRKVCDPEGGVAWIHRRGTDGVRTVVSNASEAVAVHKNPDEASPTVALLRPRSIAFMDKEKNGWLLVHADGEKGWIMESSVWGTQKDIKCH
jgi:SH3-like domain-containing protein